MAKKKGAGRPKSAKKPEVVQEDVSEEVPKVQSGSEPESEEERPKSKSRGRPSSKKSSSKARAVEEDEDEGVESDNEQAKAKTPGKKGRKSGKTSPDITDEAGDDEEENRVAATPSKGRGRPKKAENVSPDIIEEEDEEESPTKKGKGRPKKADKRKSEAATKDSKKAKRAAPASKKGQSDDDSEDETEEYEVDRILDVQNLRNGKREFLIKWKGYGKNDATWEPESHLDCKELLAAFMIKIEDNNVPRSRRLSSRTSTTMSTRISETPQIDLLNTVKEGRVDKMSSRRSSSRVSSYSSTRSGGLNSLSVNGGMLSSVSENVINVRHKKQRTSFKGVVRAAVISCGMVVSLSAAMLYSTNSAISWDSVTLQAQEVINSFKEKFGSYYQSTVDSTMDQL